MLLSRLSAGLQGNGVEVYEAPFSRIRLCLRKVPESIGRILYPMGNSGGSGNPGRAMESGPQN